MNLRVPRAAPHAHEPSSRAGARPTARSRIAGRLAGVVALAVALVSSLPAATNGATLSAASAVGPSNFPTIGQVATIFPVYSGGERTLFPGRDVQVSEPSCLSFMNGDVLARAGKTASYAGPGSSDPYFNGGIGVTVAVHEFKTKKNSQSALEEQRKRTSDCFGDNVDSDGYSMSFQLLRAPQFGQGSFSYREQRGDINTGTDVFATVFTRQGRFLIRTTLQRDAGALPAEPLFRLTRVALRALS